MIRLLVVAVALMVTSFASSVAAIVPLAPLGSTAVARVPKSEAHRDEVVIHFHGVPELVLESYDEAGFGDRVVVVVNAGTVIGDYTSRFAGATQWRQLTRDIAALTGATPKRVALSAWSAGFGAVLRALQLDEEGISFGPRIDAALIFDGFHASRRHDGSWFEHTMGPVARYADLARRGEVLLVLTHSAIATPYPSTTQSIDGLLEVLALTAKAEEEDVPRPEVEILKRYPGPRVLHRTRSLEQQGLAIAGFDGCDARAHVGHIQFMSVLGLRRLHARWREEPR